MIFRREVIIYKEGQPIFRQYYLLPYKKIEDFPKNESHFRWELGKGMCDNPTEGEPSKNMIYSWVVVSLDDDEREELRIKKEAQAKA